LVYILFIHLLTCLLRHIVTLQAFQRRPRSGIYYEETDTPHYVKDSQEKLAAAAMSRREDEIRLIPSAGDNPKDCLAGSHARLISKKGCFLPGGPGRIRSMMDYDRKIANRIPSGRNAGKAYRHNRRPDDAGGFTCKDDHKRYLVLGKNFAVGKIAALGNGQCGTDFRLSQR